MLNTILCRALTLIFATILLCSSVEEGPYPVVSVYDGDTITVMRNDIKEDIRLLSVDTPEIKDNPHGRAMPEGQEAKDLTQQILSNYKEVYLWGPNEVLKRDKFERLLAVIVLSKGSRQTLQYELIRNGSSVYSLAYGKSEDPGLHRLLTKAEYWARTERRGIWSSNRKWMLDMKAVRRVKEPAPTNEEIQAEIDLQAKIKELWMAEFGPALVANPALNKEYKASIALGIPWIEAYEWALAETGTEPLLASAIEPEAQQKSVKSLTPVQLRKYNKLVNKIEYYDKNIEKMENYLRSSRSIGEEINPGSIGRLNYYEDKRNESLSEIHLLLNE